jgi:hypothetical protein
VTVEWVLNRIEFGICALGSGFLITIMVIIGEVFRRRVTKVVWAATFEVTSALRAYQYLRRQHQAVWCLQ